MVSSVYGLENLEELPQVLLRITNYEGDDLFSWNFLILAKKILL